MRRPDPENELAFHPSEPSFCRPTAAGKFLANSGKKLWIRGVTYGTFRPRPNGDLYPDHAAAESDLSRIAANGLNAIRTYTVPPRWLLDAAFKYKLRIMVGLPWEQLVAFVEDKAIARRIEERIRAGVRTCAGHPAILCYAIGNEIPAPIVRWHGRRAIERYLERLFHAAKEEDPDGLVTYVNYPTTEYLDLPFLDFACFNVYLESQDRLKAYLARLQNLAGDRPLLLGEVGLDSRRNGEVNQAQVLDWQIRTAFAAGCAGTFVFGWTDEWYRGGSDIDDWDFGLTLRDRQPKLALSVVRQAFADVPFLQRRSCSRVSVVVCSFNGARTIRDCLDGLSKLEYPNYEVIVVDDGSTDSTWAIATEYNCRVIHTENRGLASARNTGLKEATGEFVAYLDDDAWPDPHWLHYLVETFQSTDHAGVGGPNLPPPGDGYIADCVANAPGGPVHVLLSDQVAEHIPGCNMTFRKSCLEAIGGFDVQFRTAGDDVDVCWRLQEKGWTLGFHAAALVWHHRRNSVRAYWHQQRDYGKAEALLEQKWPEKYEPSGSLTWGGRVYCKALERALVIRSRIYHGMWGSAPFQSLYQPASGLWQSLPLMPEWFLVILLLAILSALGLLWGPLLGFAPILIAAVSVSLAQALNGATRASFMTNETKHRSHVLRLGKHGLTACLYLLQPLARLSGRLRAGLTPWRIRMKLAPSLPRPQRFQFWSERWRESGKILQSVEGVLRAHGAVVSRGGDFDRWDLQIRAGLFGGVRLFMYFEAHGAGKQLIQFRVWPRCSPGGLAAGMLLAFLAMAATWDGAWTVGMLLGAMALWPLGRTVLECGVARSVIVRGLKQLWPPGAL
jgi:cellulose synthase/poly-beta-1,6-N-acetylglucosamine synthase-like glycosyltransferase